MIVQDSICLIIVYFIFNRMMSYLYITAIDTLLYDLNEVDLIWFNMIGSSSVLFYFYLDFKREIIYYVIPFDKLLFMLRFYFSIRYTFMFYNIVFQHFITGCLSLHWNQENIEGDSTALIPLYSIFSISSSFFLFILCFFFFLFQSFLFLSVSSLMHFFLKLTLLSFT